MATKENLADAFMTGPEHMVELFHGHTYSGYLLAAAAGLATLDIYKDEGPFERAHKLEPVFAEARMSLKGETNVGGTSALSAYSPASIWHLCRASPACGYEATERIPRHQHLACGSPWIRWSRHRR